MRGVVLTSRKGPRIETLKSLAAKHRITVQQKPAAELSQICGHDRHQGVVLLPEEGGPEEKQSLRDLLGSLTGSARLIVFLDELGDTHNFGAILRSADQFSVDLVITTTRRSVTETPAVLKTSAGASSYVRLVRVPNLVQAIQLCKQHDFWIYGADLAGESLTRQSFAGRVALVMGGEQRGLRRLVKENCDALVRIPAKGHVDSFNVSVAAGILLYEVRRQQGFP